MRVLTEPDAAGSTGVTVKASESDPRYEVPQPSFVVTVGVLLLTGSRFKMTIPAKPLRSRRGILNVYFRLGFCIPDKLIRRDVTMYTSSSNNEQDIY